MNRRFFFISLPFFLAGCASDHDKWVHHLAFGEMDMKMNGENVVWNPKMPPATVVRKGNPHYIDFGHGVHVPLSKDAFYTLWEGPDYWLVYGAGWAGAVNDAYQRSTRAAIATMKLLLMTLAFAPDKLVRSDGGWRLREQKAENYVRGVLPLPGKPFPPQSDTSHSFGNVSAAGDTARAFAQAATLSQGAMTAHSAANGVQLQIQSQTFDFMTALGDSTKIVAVCCYLIPKQDVDLAYVRKNTLRDSLVLRPAVTMPRTGRRTKTADGS